MPLLWRVGLWVVVAFALTACVPPPAAVENTDKPVMTTAVVVQSVGGILPTRPAVRTPEPTPTTDLAVLIRTVQPFLTRTPGPPETPTPTVVPAYTTTPRPIPTPPRSSFPQPPLTVVVTRAPTSTPAPRGTFTGPGVPGARLGPTETPVDLNEPNDTPGSATPLDNNPLQAFINGPNDVDVYRVEVTNPDTVLVITISGEQVGRYKVDIVAPRNGKVGRQRLDGTVTARAIADVGTDTGTYYVYVRGAGPEMPRGPYFIFADYSVPAVTPAATPIR